MGSVRGSQHRSSVLPRGRFLLCERTWGRVAHSLRLSPRELQIVRCVFDDLKELAIAAELGISPHTVHTHLERLYHKLDVSSRVELVVSVFAEHLAIRGGQ